MPLTRIDVTDIISSDRLSALADALHQAEVETIGITPDNRHQLIHVHQAGQIITDKRAPDHTGSIGGVEEANSAPHDTLTPDDLAAEWQAPPTL